jgi:uncharacterized membrane protein YgaE (UPF0421/DUF939 family)
MVARNLASISGVISLAREKRESIRRAVNQAVCYAIVLDIASVHPLSATVFL